MAGPAPYLIIGNGIAGVTAAETLRTEDSEAPITVIADDPFPVYYRPALKDYLAGRVREDKLWARPNSFYQNQRIRFISDRVQRIQAGQHLVELESGRQLSYRRLLLASGARASRLACPGSELAGVYTLRTVADYQRVLQALETARKIIVCGSGTLALETIETLTHRGFQVCHLLRGSTLWSEVLDATASDLVIQQERRAGVDLRLEEEIVEISGSRGRITGVRTTKGNRLPCDLLISAIGIEPLIDYIRDSGIPCGRGVRIDPGLRTGAPDIYAAGDVVETQDPVSGKARVIGQWFPATQQGRAAAYSMLDRLDSKRPVQWTRFYNATFLFGLDFAASGMTQRPVQDQAYQEIIAEPKPRVYRKALLRDGVLVGSLLLGDRSQALALKRALDQRVDLTAVATRLFADDFRLGAWLDQQNVSGPELRPARALDPAENSDVETVIKTRATESLLIATDGKDRRGPSEVVLSRERPNTIGRQVGVYHLIDHGSVSRRHAEIGFSLGKFILRDVGSANGTFVNDRRLSSNETHNLASGERLRFGDIAYTYLVRSISSPSNERGQAGGSAVQETGFYDISALGEPVATPSGQPIVNADGSLSLPGANVPLPVSEAARLREQTALVILTHGQPSVYDLRPGQIVTLGRDAKQSIVLADPAVSRKHARIFHAPDGFYIRDVASSNGVIINQARVENPYRLVHGDRLVIGDTQFYFYDAANKGAQTVVAVEPEAGHCGVCGAIIVNGARFCANCGAPLR